MLEEYKQDYQEFYTIINNAIKENRISHAYMFELEESIDQDSFIKDLCKALLIKNNDDEILRNLIDNDNYPNIKRIINNGLWIKKEQIMEIQKDFKKESFDDNLKIYIIEDAAKLTKESANTLLKFLEEPERNIVAILLTKNKYSVINTIVSRCLNISLKKKSFLEIDEEDPSYKMVEIIEKYGSDSLPYLYQLIVNGGYDRKEFKIILENVQKIYNDLLHKNNNLDKNYNYFLEESLKNINYLNDNELLIKKIDSIYKVSSYIIYNINIKTLLDKIIIGIYGGD